MVVYGNALIYAIIILEADALNIYFSEKINTIVYFYYLRVKV